MSFISISFAVLFLILLIAYHLIAYYFEKNERNAAVFQNVFLLMHTAFKTGHWSVEKGTFSAQKRTA